MRLRVELLAVMIDRGLSNLKISKKNTRQFKGGNIHNVFCCRSEFYSLNFLLLLAGAVYTMLSLRRHLAGWALALASGEMAVGRTGWTSACCRVACNFKGPT